MRILLISLVLVSACVMVLAEKPTSYTILDNLHGNIRFNEPTGDGNFTPMVVNLDGLAKTPDGGRRGVRVLRNVGTSSNVSLEGKALYDALPAWARPLLKELYLEAINVNVTE